MASQRRQEGTPCSPKVYISPRRTTAAAATSPPPLNSRTKPNYRQTNPPQSNTTGVFSTRPRLLPVYVEHDHLADIQSALHYFGLPLLLVLEDVPNDLSTSADTAPVTPFTTRTGPIFTSGPSSSPAKRNVEKYYAIIVGKCAGVYWNEWDNVFPLVSNVLGARYKGFTTLEAAQEYYLASKRMGKVRIVRDPGDDQAFGPESQAIQ